MVARKRTQSASSDRSAAIAVGALYLCGTIAGILSAVAVGGGIDGPNPLAEAALLGNRLATAAVLVLIMGLSLAAIPIVLFPILRMTSERLAVGYLVVRGALETVTYIGIAASWLIMLALSQNAPSGSEVSGIALSAAADVAAGPVLSIVFPVGAALFYWALFCSRLVPRWLSGWGLVAVVPYLTLGVLQIFDLATSGSTIETALVVPMGLQELALAFWLIVRGFSRPANRDPDPIVTRGAPAL